MMSRLRLTCLAIFLMGAISQAKAQFPTDDGIWNLLLDDITIRYRYSFKHEGFLPKPKFGDRLLEMNGQEVTIAGFFLPANITGSSFVVSYYPMAMCFFCSGAGIESVVVMYAEDGEERRLSNLRTDDFIEVKGRLELNDDMDKNLFYILRDARWVKTYR